MCLITVCILIMSLSLGQLSYAGGLKVSFCPISDSIQCCRPPGCVAFNASCKDYTLLLTFSFVSFQGRVLDISPDTCLLYHLHQKYCLMQQGGWAYKMPPHHHHHTSHHFFALLEEKSRRWVVNPMPCQFSSILLAEFYGLMPL